MIDYNKINELLQEGFLENKGKGSVLVYNPLDVGKVLLGTLIKLVVKRPNEKILIVLYDYTDKIRIHKTIDSILEPNEANYLKARLQFLTKSYAYNHLYEYTTNIIINIDDVSFIEKSSKESKFTLAVITNPKIKLNILNSIQALLPNINIGITANQLQSAKINSPVKEWRVGVYLSEEDTTKYDKYTTFIKDSMVVFNDFNHVEFCRVGDKLTNCSAMDFCTNVAKRNGWSPNLDMSVDYNVQIDNIYNPNAIHERAQLIYNITRERKNFVCNYESKINKVVDIVSANPNNKILIVSKSGDFANEISEHLVKNSIPCGLYHNEIPASYMPDENGELITYKSGENKGKAKLFKSASLSTYWERMYNLNAINVLSIKSASDVNLRVKVDIIIFTTTLVDNIFKFKARFKNCKFDDNCTNIYRIYCKNTIEEISMTKEQPSNLITICSDNELKSVQYDELTGDIII